MAKRLPTLKTIDGIKQNLEQVYREARKGSLPVQDASKLAHVLKTLLEMHVKGDLEKRIEQLEAEL